MSRPLKIGARIGFAVLALALALPASAYQLTILGDRPTGGTEDTVLVGDISNVASLTYNNGSDLEFVTKRVVKLSNGATGDPVCERDAEGSCVVDENGQIVYQTEERDFAILGRLSFRAWVVDITDPRNPVKVAELPCTMNQNDIQIWGDLALQAADGTPGNCLREGTTNQTGVNVGISDISNPRAPRFLSRIQWARGAHNVTVHPTEPLAYISDSDQAHTGLGEIGIWDFSTPSAPRQVTPIFKFAAHSPHDITFNADGTRAYAAARFLTYILNTEDPRQPTVISAMPHAGYLSHQSDPTPDGKYLLVSEELLGAGFDTASPGGPVHVWDIRDETKPVEVGAFANDATGLNGVSTSHVFRINPDGYTMAIAWYNDGIGVMDFSDIRGINAAGSSAATGFGPRVLAWAKLPGADAWAAKMWQERHPGYVFVNDIARGFDVFYVPELGPGFVAYGTIRAGHDFNYADDIGVTREEWESECEFTPRTNGVDGWVTRLPANAAGRELTASGTPALFHDLDLYFYDENCTFLGADEDAGDDETGEVPEGAAFVMVTNYEYDTGTRVRISIR
jgi:WD40 repeat protein